MPRLLERAGYDVRAYERALEEELGRLPRVSGPGAQPGQVYVTQGERGAGARQRAGQSMKDEYVSVEHLFLALLDEPPAAGRAR